MTLYFLHNVLRMAGVRYAPGLSDDQLRAAEFAFGFTWPPELRAFLSHSMPFTHGFPDWRRLDDTHLLEAMRAPEVGILYDVERNNFWNPSWGERPKSMMAALALARELIQRAPKLIPIIGHRYMPEAPTVEGNPVLSVVQTDIIYYASDLTDCLHRDFPAWFDSPQADVRRPLRPVPFWSSLVEFYE